MGVYVDQAKHSYRGMKMSHLLSDNLDELHAMAEKVGLKMEWFQPGSTPHYDLCQAKRAQAIDAGAIVINNRQVVVLIRKWRGRV